ncbi:hypothetical protein [Streptococcus ferus]|uniref:hypothetical protein n=1 Tax=Streptococcus ferus TaxID=1345 RepID=UPI00359FABF3
MGARLIRLFLCVFAGITLFACHKALLSDNLTVANIHNDIVRNRTNVLKLEKLYGEPYKIVKDNKKVVEIFRYWNNYEGGVNSSLEGGTNYWQTVKFTSSSEKFDYTKLESYYEYRGKNLGVKSVYFFIRDNKVQSFRFNGSITNKSVAKKDKYLRQIID